MGICKASVFSGAAPVAFAPWLLLAGLSGCGDRGPGPGGAGAGGAAGHAGAGGHAQAGQAGSKSTGGAAGHAGTPGGQGGDESSGASRGEGGAEERGGAGGSDTTAGGTGGMSAAGAGAGGTSAGASGTGTAGAGAGGMSGGPNGGLDSGGQSAGGSGGTAAGTTNGGGMSGGAGGGGTAPGCEGQPFVDCPCLKVTLDGDDTAASTSGGLSPFKTLQAAIDFSSAHRNVATNVCVAPGTSCGLTGTFEYGTDGQSLTMADGVSVYGNYEASAWTRCSNSTTNLRSEALGTGVAFGASITHPTVLDGFSITGDVGTSGATILVDGAQKVTLSHLTVSAYDVNGPRTSAVLAQNGATVTLSDASIGANPGKADVVAVAATSAVVALTNSTLAAYGEGKIAAVEFSDAPGSSVTYCTLSVSPSTQTGAPTEDAAAVRVLGDATNVQVSGNDVSATGPYYAVAGIVADCTGAPSIAGNDVRASNPSEGFVSGQPATVALSVSGGCAATVSGNQLLSVGGAGIDNVGLACDGPCVIHDNDVACDKSTTTPNATEGAATGLSCNGCSEIRGNQLTGLVTPSGIHTSTAYHAAGASVVGSTLVAQNDIHGGCGADSVGLTAVGGRLENNLISGRDFDETCGTPATYAISSIGLHASAGADVHSNYIRSSLTPASGQPSTGALTDASVTLRNNFIAGNVAALDGGWAVLENNAFQGPVANVADATALNALSGAAANIFAECTTSASSPCIDAGTTTGAPSTDYRGVPRDSKPDIGAYEYVASADPCAGQACSGHGSCGIGLDGATCSCSPGYQLASGDPLSCVVDPCFNYGGCDVHTSCTPDGGGGRICGACPPGTTGTGDTRCDDIDECAQSPCDPLTTCQNSFGSYSCGSCPTGYGGNGYDGCVYQDLCNPNPCVNDGICWSDGSVYLCNCNNGLMGQNCELTFTALSGSYLAFCGIRTDGTLRCWGSNANGELSAPSGHFTALDMGDGYGCALRDDGTLACWGVDVDGRTSPPSGTFTALSTGPNHACAVRTDGTLACWGNDAYQAAEAPSGTFLGVAAGFGATCAIRSADRSLLCWGDPTDGGTTPPAGAFKAVDLGQAFGCALELDGTLACWGRSTSGQTSPSITVATAFQLGAASGFALAPDGTPVGWGLSGLGIGGSTAGTYSVIGSGISTTECAVHAGYGTLQCWGRNDTGQATPPTGLP